MSSEIESGPITVGDLDAYLARPAGGSAQGMLLLPMITGIGAQLRDWADELAREGFTALVWDPFHGVNDDNTPFDELFPHMAALDDEVSLSEQSALLDHLLGPLGVQRAGVIGWCLGGRFALLLAGRDARVASVVAYHPTVPGEPYPNHTADAVKHCAKITAPVLMLYPGQDSLVPVESFGALQSALQARADAPTVVQVYPQAQHGFANRTAHDDAHNAAAWALSWPQALAFVHATTGASGGQR
jgi:carboxymethylenebutenolidase